jgi:hypothetical protein
MQKAPEAPLNFLYLNTKLKILILNKNNIQKIYNKNENKKNKKII